MATAGLRVVDHGIDNFQLFDSVGGGHSGSDLGTVMAATFALSALHLKAPAVDYFVLGRLLEGEQAHHSTNHSTHYCFSDHLRSRQ